MNGQNVMIPMKIFIKYDSENRIMIIKNLNSQGIHLDLPKYELAKYNDSDTRNMNTKNLDSQKIYLLQYDST